MAIKVDQYTKEQAKTYANAEAKRQGFELGSPEWIATFKSYLNWATGTMSVGRNPRGKNHYQIIQNAYPQVFGSDGFAGKISRNYVDQTGQSLTKDQASERILSAVHNLMKLFENGILGIKNTTKGNKPGRIRNADMSDLQFPNKDEFSNEDEYHAAIKDVVFNWLVRDLVTNCIIESLSPFWKMSAQDVDAIMGKINVEVDPKNFMKMMGSAREEFVNALRARVEPKIDQIDFKKLIVG